MAGWKQLQQQYEEENEQFYADIEASVIHHPDNPVQIGPNWMSWSVTMPLEEYDARQQHLHELSGDVKNAREAEHTDLALDLFLHESE